MRLTQCLDRQAYASKALEPGASVFVFEDGIDSLKTYKVGYTFAHRLRDTVPHEWKYAGYRVFFSVREVTEYLKKQGITSTGWKGY